MNHRTGPVFLLLIFSCCASAQKPRAYNLADLLAKNEIVTFDSLETKPLAGRKGAINSKGNIWFKHIGFTEGTIDIDLRGKNEFLKSFLGIHFHGSDTTHYDELYFRPFNFKHPDTARHHWSVQYAVLPEYNYAVLRKAHPLQYESTVTPVPDPEGWFHASIVVTSDSLKVYVNHSPVPSLQVRLLNSRHDGLLGLYSDGLSADYADLVITPANNRNTVKYDLPGTPDKEGAIESAGLNWIKDAQFTNGTIDVDLKGRDVFQQSFLGIAFHGGDTANYDVVYFRPFNFRSADTLRRQHAVQYMSIPSYPWDRLRKEHPLVYEQPVHPAPGAEDWFHATIVVKNKWISVYVNHAASPSLQAELLAGIRNRKIGLWADGLKGRFANLVITED